MANARWSVDFVQDQFADGRRFRILNVIDDVTKESLAAVVDTVARPEGLTAYPEIGALLRQRIDTLAPTRIAVPSGLERSIDYGLEHDGKPRLDKWLLWVLGYSQLDIERMAPKLRRYIEHGGFWHAPLPESARDAGRRSGRS